MRKPRIEDLVMSQLFPQRKEIDPGDWQTHVRRSLVQEVRTEIVCFYGPFDCLEAQYPGLDYAKPAHRLRLNRFPSHRKLFRVFDELRLTDYEIQRLCKWEGTRWARETYESNNRVKIKDTTWNVVPDARNKRTTVTVAPFRTGGTIDTGIKEISDDDVESEGEDEEMRDSDDGDELSEEESEDELQRSVGVDLNRRLRIATEARTRGEDASIAADWEQWLKEAAERGDLPELSRTLNPTLTPAAASVYWGREVPEYLSEDSATLLARLPPPPQYFPPVEESSLTAEVVAVLPPAPPAGAAM